MKGNWYGQQALSFNNTYVIDIENATETARLIDQDGLFTEAMGGLLPEQEDMSSVGSLLDIACGPGSWTNEVAMTYPQMQVVGVDINQTMIDYACAIARVRLLKNVSFQVMDVCQPLPFANATFDFVNGRFLVGFLDKASWPVLLAECFRVLAPGGIVRLTECEMGITSSPSLQQLGHYLTRALQTQGRTFSADGNTIGIAHMLGRLLRQAGLRDIQRRAFLLRWAIEEDFM